MIKKSKMKNDDNNKKLLISETSSTGPVDYIMTCKGILSEHGADKTITVKILKLVLEMNQELNYTKQQLNDQSIRTSSNTKPDTEATSKEILTKLKDISDSLGRRSYAQAAFTTPKNVKRAVSTKAMTEGHVLRIYPTLEKNKISMTDVKSTLLPHLRDHPLNRTKEIRNGGVLIELARKSSTEIVSEILKQNSKLPIKIVGDRLRSPQFIIKGISAEYALRKPEEVVNLFRELNKLPEEAIIIHKTFLNLKSGDKHWIIETDGPTAKILLNTSTVYLEFTRHRILENFYVPVCSHCRGIGHIKKYCLKTDITICHKCGKEHTTKDCKEDSNTCWICSDKPKHKASCLDCPAYNIRFKQIMSSVNYE